jgi:hypothetical protein
MSNIILASLQCSPSQDNFEQAQVVLLDVSSNLNLSANNAWSLSLAFGDQFQGYPSLASAIARGSIIQPDPRGCPVLLAKDFVVNGALGTKQNIFTVPAGFSCIPTLIVLKEASVSLATLSISFGFNAAAANVIANATHTGLTGPTLAKNLVPIAAAYTFGVAGDAFGVIANTPQDPSNVTVDVVGYYF